MNMLQLRQSHAYKYYCYMAKQRSSTQLWTSDCFVAVYPVSLTFERTYKTPFHLYFERGLQIISKHQTPLDEVRAQQTVKFQNQQQIHYFRVQSDNNFDYQWSLYIFRVDMEGDNQQFIEGQKITLSNHLNAFHGKCCLFQESVKFKKIRCQLGYVVAISGSLEEIAECFQKKLGSKKLPALTLAHKTNSSSKQHQQLQKVLLRTGEGFLDKAQVQKVEGKNNQMQLNLSPQRMLKKRSDPLLSPYDENPKLTKSQLDIGEQIEQKVINKQNSIKQNAVSRQNRNSLVIEQKNIRMTNSQLLNEKKEVLAPLYLQKRFIWGLLCLIVLIFGSGVWLLAKNAPSIPQPKGKKDKRTKQTNKQVGSKKRKGKK